MAAERMKNEPRIDPSLIGGVMLWELSSDRQGVLIDALNAELR